MSLINGARRGDSPCRLMTFPQVSALHAVCRCRGQPTTSEHFVDTLCAPKSILRVIKVRILLLPTRTNEGFRQGYPECPSSPSGSSSHGQDRSSSSGLSMKVGIVVLELDGLSGVRVPVHSPLRRQLIEQADAPAPGLARSSPDRRD